jgi:hypothetical protein
MRWLGRTFASETAVARGEELGAEADALLINAFAPAGLKIAPFFLFNAAHWPDFAPCAIS